MAQGLQVFDAAGALLLDTNTRVFTLLGYVDTGTTNGSISVPAFTRGTPMFFVGLVSSGSMVDRPPGVTISGTTLSWLFGTGYSSGTNISARIYYGVY